jgi:hypothetical protein
MGVVPRHRELGRGVDESEKANMLLSRAGCLPLRAPPALVQLTPGRG